MRLHSATLLIALAAPLLGQSREAYLGEPIRYEDPARRGPVERLAAALEAGELVLEESERGGVLPAVLAALDVPVSSQMLVFSRTSFQERRISPANPRAVYFGDEVYVGAVPGTRILELTSMDPDKGPVFYTLTTRRDAPPLVERRDDECLQCHGGSMTRDFPGNLVRSVHPDARGQPITRAGSFLVGHDTPLEQRWGGWYVTGTHGEQRHMGNAVVGDGADFVDVEAGANVTDLAERVDLSRHLTPHSDLVALMVLEHQAEMHSRIARAGYRAKLALHRQIAINEMSGDPPDHMREATLRQLEREAVELVEYLLFVDEVLLTAPVRGTSAFAEEFAARGRRDPEGRSLRDLDLETRLLRHPCSWLIHSPSLAALPAPLLELVHAQLWSVLGATPAEDGCESLSAADRSALREILLETTTPLPSSWR
jgi:hypothetical protein